MRTTLSQDELVAKQIIAKRKFAIIHGTKIIHCSWRRFPDQSQLIHHDFTFSFCKDEFPKPHFPLKGIMYVQTSAQWGFFCGWPMAIEFPSQLSPLFIALILINWLNQICAFVVLFLFWKQANARKTALHHHYYNCQFMFSTASLMKWWGENKVINCRLLNLHNKISFCFLRGLKKVNRYGFESASAHFE